MLLNVTTNISHYIITYYTHYTAWLDTQCTKLDIWWGGRDWRIWLSLLCFILAGITISIYYMSISTCHNENNDHSKQSGGDDGTATLNLDGGKNLDKNSSSDPKQLIGSTLYEEYNNNEEPIVLGQGDSMANALKREAEAKKAELRKLGRANWEIKEIVAGRMSNPLQTSTPPSTPPKAPNVVEPMSYSKMMEEQRRIEEQKINTTKPVTETNLPSRRVLDPSPLNTPAALRAMLNSGNTERKEKEKAKSKPPQQTLNLGSNLPPKSNTNNGVPPPPPAMTNLKLYNERKKMAVMRERRERKEKEAAKNKEIQKAAEAAKNKEIQKAAEEAKQAKQKKLSALRFNEFYFKNEPNNKQPAKIPGTSRNEEIRAGAVKLKTGLAAHQRQQSDTLMARKNINNARAALKKLESDAQKEIAEDIPENLTTVQRDNAIREAKKHLKDMKKEKKISKADSKIAKARIESRIKNIDKSLKQAIKKKDISMNRNEFISASKASKAATESILNSTSQNLLNKRARLTDKKQKKVDEKQNKNARRVAKQNYKKEFYSGQSKSVFKIHKRLGDKLTFAHRRNSGYKKEFQPKTIKQKIINKAKQPIRSIESYSKNKYANVKLKFQHKAAKAEIRKAFDSGKITVYERNKRLKDIEKPTKPKKTNTVTKPTPDPKTLYTQTPTATSSNSVKNQSNISKSLKGPSPLSGIKVGIMRTVKYLATVAAPLAVVAAASSAATTAAIAAVGKNAEEAAEKVLKL